MCLLPLIHVYALAGNDELQKAYRQRATEEAATALAKQQAAELAVEMADARAAAVAEQYAQAQNQKQVPKVLAKNYGILHDGNPATPAPGSPAAAVAIAAAAAQGGVRGRNRGKEQNFEQQQLSRLEIQAKDQLDAVLRQALQRQTQQQQQQQQRARAVQAKKKAKKKKKTQLSQSQSAADEVKQIVHLLAGGRHGVYTAVCPSIDYRYFACLNTSFCVCTSSRARWNFISSPRRRNLPQHSHWHRRERQSRQRQHEDEEEQGQRQQRQGAEHAALGRPRSTFCAEQENEDDQKQGQGKRKPGDGNRCRGSRALAARERLASRDRTGLSISAPTQLDAALMDFVCTNCIAYTIRHKAAAGRVTIPPSFPPSAEEGGPSTPAASSAHPAAP